MKEDKSILVEIPGRFIAKYEDGRITGMDFWPAASDAGYFGPSAVIFDGHTPEDLFNAEESLDVENVEGPFWSAVQNALAARLPIEWSE